MNHHQPHAHGVGITFSLSSRHVRLQAQPSQGTQAGNDAAASSFVFPFACGSTAF